MSDEIEKTQADDRFGEILAGFLYEALRAGGVAMQATSAYERVRSTGERMAHSINHNARRKAIEVAKELQVATVKAFKAIEQDISTLKKENEKLKKRVKKLEGKNEDITIRPD